MVFQCKVQLHLLLVKLARSTAFEPGRSPPFPLRPAGLQDPSTEDSGRELGGVSEIH